ncbi:MAG: hypothetical protein HOE92_02820 [Euryarchaeota archaeon]|jgi:hypothetical protein|nr:hypothetical protein [Euryarchaeota archaeon]MBT3971134.1 hypothetical protein [Euryarchaeota archaeon]MBT4407696.1 hypothetical protein [Euryarchaeota archaeon]MBT6644601.1 hypothetical protein [Euryarchaeota archaeon]
MAEDVQIQSEGIRSLHLRILRKQWQILTLQVIATIALVWMYLTVFQTYVLNSIDHTMLLSVFNNFLVNESGGEHSMPLAEWMTGIGNSGLGRVYMPLILGAVFGGGMAFISFQTPERQQKIKFGLTGFVIIILVGPLLLGWSWDMLTSWDLKPPSTEQWDSLVWPISIIISLAVMGFYFLPIILGTKGIWGLSRRSIGWAIGFTLIFLAIHAILTFPLIMNELGTSGNQLLSLETQVGEPEVGLFGYEMITQEQFSLILIAVLLMVFQESGFAVIRYLEYAYRLPESCKKDPEYVRQMDNILNGHIWHTGFMLGGTGVTTMIALGFHRMLLDFVDGISGSQWANQVGESIELQLTYGLVISALLFLLLTAALRFIVPWQRVSGWVEYLRQRVKGAEEEEVVKTYV